MKISKKDLKPIEDVVNDLSARYPDTSFSFEVRNYGKERLPDFAIYASDSWVKPCGSCHCNCGNTGQGGRERFLEEINQMLNDKVKTKRARDKRIREQIDEKQKKADSLKEDIDRLKEKIK